MFPCHVASHSLHHLMNFWSSNALQAHASYTVAWNHSLLLISAVCILLWYMAVCVSIWFAAWLFIVSNLIFSGKMHWAHGLNQQIILVGWTFFAKYNIYTLIACTVQQRVGRELRHDYSAVCNWTVTRFLLVGLSIPAHCLLKENISCDIRLT